MLGSEISRVMDKQTMDCQYKRSQRPQAMDVDIELEESEQKLQTQTMTQTDDFMSGVYSAETDTAFPQDPEAGTFLFCQSEIVESDDDEPECVHNQRAITILPLHSSGRKRIINTTDKRAGSILKVKKKKHSKTKDERLSYMKRFTSYQLNVDDPKLFVETRAFKKSKELLHNLGIVVVIGSPGSGKTTLGLNLLSVTGDLEKRQLLFLTHHTQFEDLPIPKDLKNIKDKDKWVIMIDDMFGRSNLVTEFQRSWELRFPKLWHLIEVGLIKVIITCRSQIFHECQTNLAEFVVFQESHIIDLHKNDYSLNTDEKMSILDEHLNKWRVTMTDDDKDLAVSLGFTELGFPQCCHFYVNSPAAQQRGVDYFRKPIEYLRRQLDKIKSQNDSQFEYLVLLTVMFKQGTLSESCLDPFAEDRDTLNLIRTLKGVCRINTDVSPGQIKSSAKSLCGLYLQYNSEHKDYSFIHQSVFDTLFLQFSSEFLQQSIKICPVSMLLEYVVTPDAPQKGAITVTVDKENYPILAQRFTDELKSDNARDILSHESFTDEEFVKYLIEGFWKSAVPCEILSQKLDPKSHQIPVVFHGGNVEELWDQFEDSPDISNFSFTYLASYSELFTDLVITSSPSTIAVMENLKTLSYHFVSNLCKMNFSLINTEQEKEQEQHQEKKQEQNQEMKQEQDQELEEILNISCFVGNAEVADMLLTFGIVPTPKTFTAAAVSQTDNVTILENIFNHKNDLQLSLDDLGSMLFLGLENGNGNISSLLIDAINRMEDNDAILMRAVKQLLLQCHQQIETKISGEYLFKRLTTGAASLFKKLLRYAAGCKPEVVMFLAAGHTDCGVLKELISMNPTCLNTKDNKTILHIASHYGCVDSVSLLIDQGCDVTVANNDKQTPLHLAAEYNTSDVVLLLLRKGADPNVTDADNNSPLRLAIQDSCIESVKALVENGAQLTIVDASGEAAIHTAARTSSVECVKYLLDKGSPINLLDDNDMAPLHIAAQYRRNAVGLYLLQHGADPYLTKTSNLLLHWAVYADSLEAAELLVEKKLDIDAANGSGDTPLHIAVETNSLRLVKFLVEKGSKVNLPNCYGITPLHIAVKCQMPDVGLYLLGKGADVNLLDSKKSSPLHLAVDAVALEITKALIGKGASLNSVDGFGDTPLHIAIKSKSAESAPSTVTKESQINRGITGRRLDVCKYLLRNGADHNMIDIDKKSPLHLAVISDSLYIAQRLVENGAKVNATDNDERTPLHIAAQGSSLAFVKYLIEQGSSLNMVDVGGKTALHIAAQSSTPDVSVYILSKGADPNLTDAENNSPLHFAVRANCFDLLKALHVKGANVDTLDPHGNTALHIAAEYSSLQIVRLLVDKGSQLNLPNKNGKTPLHLASRNQASDVGVCLVHSGADPNVKDSRNNTPLHMAVYVDYPHLVEALVERGAQLNSADESGQTPLHIAAQYSSIQVISYIVEKGCCVETPDNKGKTPLHLAAEHNSLSVCLYLLDKGCNHGVKNEEAICSLLHLAARKCYIDLVKALVESGENMNVTDESGNTPLHIAIENNSMELVTYLVNEGCEINTQNKAGMTPLSLAISDTNIELSSYLFDNGADCNTTDKEKKTFPLHLSVHDCALDLVKTLVEHGADLNATDSSGNTALHVAVRNESAECVEFLVEQGADVNKTNTLRKTPLFLAGVCDSPELSLYLLSKGANPTIIDYMNDSPMHLACFSGSVELQKALLDKGASVNVLNYAHDTPLHYAIKCNYSLEYVTNMVEQGAEVNVKNADGKTPLHISARFDFPDLVSYLLKKGADPNIPDKEMETPLHSAVKNCSSDSVKVLVAEGANVNAVNVLGNSPLHIAVQSESSEIMTHLVERGCQVNVINKKGLSPLDLVVRQGNPDMAVYLLHKGADPHVTGATNLLLQLAVQENSLKLLTMLMEKGIKLETEDPSRNTLLHIASRRSSPHIVRYLLERDLEVNKANDRGITPLHLAAAGLRPLNMASVGYKVIRILLDAGSDVHAKDDQGYTPLIYACTSGELKNVQLLLEHGADPNHGNITAMHAAAGFHLLDILEKFLAKGDPKVVSEVGNSLLHVAVRWYLPERVCSHLFPDVIDGRIPLLAWRNCFDYLISDSTLEKPLLLSQEQSLDSEFEFSLIISRFERKTETEDVVDVLLRSGCGVDVRNKAGQTSLHICIEYNQLENIKLLIDKGADVTVVDEKGNSLLHYAVLGTQVDILRTLMDAGVVDVKNVDGLSAADMACTKLAKCENEHMKNKYYELLSLLNQKSDAMQH